jgi:hypothetical protein
LEFFSDRFFESDFFDSDCSVELFELLERLACASGPRIGVSARAAMVSRSTPTMAQYRLWLARTRWRGTVWTACRRCRLLLRWILIGQAAPMVTLVAPFSETIWTLIRPLAPSPTLTLTWLPLATLTWLPLATLTWLPLTTLTWLPLATLPGWTEILSSAHSAEPAVRVAVKLRPAINCSMAGAIWGSGGRHRRNVVAG